MNTNVDAKKSMLLHSEAKVEFFKNYLQRYLRILYRALYITEINIFDVFCGTGIYDNGKKGSPVVAFHGCLGLCSHGFWHKRRASVAVDPQPVTVGYKYFTVTDGSGS